MLIITAVQRLGIWKSGHLGLASVQRRVEREDSALCGCYLFEKLRRQTEAFRVDEVRISRFLSYPLLTDGCLEYIYRVVNFPFLFRCLDNVYSVDVATENKCIDLSLDPKSTKFLHPSMILFSQHGHYPSPDDVPSSIPSLAFALVYFKQW